MNKRLSAKYQLYHNKELAKIKAGFGQNSVSVDGVKEDHGRVFDQKVDVQPKYDFQHRKESIPVLQKDTDCNNEFMEPK